MAYFDLNERSEKPYMSCLIPSTLIDFLKCVPIVNLMPATSFKQVETRKRNKHSILLKLGGFHLFLAGWLDGFLFVPPAVVGVDARIVHLVSLPSVSNRTRCIIPLPCLF